MTLRTRAKKKERIGLWNLILKKNSDVAARINKWLLANTVERRLLTARDSSCSKVSLQPTSLLSRMIQSRFSSHYSHHLALFRCKQVDRDLLQKLQKCVLSYLRVGVFAGKVSKVAEDLALHVVFQWGEPAVGLFIHRVVHLQKLHQLLRLHLIRWREFIFLVFWCR